MNVTVSASAPPSLLVNQDSPNPALSKINPTREDDSHLSSSCIPLSQEGMKQSDSRELVFRNRPFYGRKQELENLHRFYQEAGSSRDASQANGAIIAVLVEGVSGTGKTALVQQFVRSLRNKSNGNMPLVLQGKCEAMTRQDPFSAIEQAFGECLGDRICQHKAWMKAIVEEISGETGLCILQGILPALSSSLRSAPIQDSPVQEDSNDEARVRGDPAIANTHQLHHVFGRLVEAVSRGRPLLLILEDLQWIDSASLELLMYLMAQHIPNFFWVGTCRRTQTEHLAKVQEHPYITTISLQNHTPVDITDCLSRELKCNAMECHVLAPAVYKKTQGNFLFTLHLLDKLQQDRANEDWDEEDVIQWVEQSNVCTVADALSDKIQHLSNPQVKQALILASYLGAQFDVPTLQLLLSQMKEDSLLQPMSHQELVQILDVAVLEGLLCNAMGTLAYQFVHDRIQEAALNMIALGPERDLLLYQIGSFLREQAVASSNDNGSDSMLFLAARHWSEIGQETKYVGTVELARLYLQCGAKARAKAAFEVAAKWFRLGLESIVALQPWKGHYDLSLQLYQSAAEAELLLGNYEHGYALGNMVLDNARTLLEKMPTYYAMDAALGLQDRHADALALNMDVLAELKAVPTTFNGIRDFFQVKRLISNTTDEEIMSLPEMTDPYQLAITHCLANAAVRAYCCGKMLLMLAITMKQVKRTLRLGLSSQAPVVFAGYGCALLSGMGHPSTGRRMGRLAKEISTQRGFNQQECKALYVVASFIELWTEPFDRAIDTFQRAYEIGLMHGNLDYGYGAELEAITASFVAGDSLDVLLLRSKRLKKEADQYNLDTMNRILDPLGILLFHLAGQNQYQPEDAGGKFSIDWDSLDLKEKKEVSSTSHYALTWAYLYRMILAFFMGNLELAERMSKRFHDNVPGQSFFFCTLGSYFSALIHSKLAHKSRSGKHKRLMNKYTKEMRKLVDHGCTKNAHKHSLLKAEYMSITNPNKHSIVQQAYDSGIAAASESGCLHDHALANELAGDYFMRQRRPQIAKRYLVMACSLYREWGARAKMNQLLETHTCILTEEDLPSRTHTTDNEVGNNHYPRFYPTISIGSISEESPDENISALTPIPENTSLILIANRWENCGSVRKTDPCASSPPKPPKRRGSACPDEATVQTEILSEDR